MEKRGTVLFFWDYDTQWGAERSRGPGGAKEWGPLEFGNTDELLDLHAEYELPACFAVVGAAALPGDRPYHDPGQIRRIHQAGHEVASHSLHHDWLPGLGRKALLETLTESKEILEQCIGTRVVTFVPPYNQPFDYPGGWSFSISERREAGNGRTGLGGLCGALHEAGYSFCRVAYRPLSQRIMERVAGRRIDRPVCLETIGGVTCVRLNSPGGFTSPAIELVNRCASEGGIAVIYGHPHSIHTGNAQDTSFLIPLMKQIRGLKKQSRIQVALPRTLVGGA
jgi:hypothetical protein